MRIIVLSILLVYSLANNLEAQTVRMVLDKSLQNCDVNTIRDLPLFNFTEIRSEKIRNCYILKVALQEKKTDTLFVFSFDKDGNIERRISFANWSPKYRDTTLSSPWNSRHGVKEIRTVTEQGSNTIERTYSIWQFQSDDIPADTATVTYRVFDKQGRLLEEKEESTQDYIDVWHCSTGLLPHRKFEYNEKGDIISLDNFRFKEKVEIKRNTSRIEFHGRDTESNYGWTQSVILKNRPDEVLEKSKYETILLRKFKKNSKLIDRVSYKQNGTSFNSADYYFVYDFFTNDTNIPYQPTVTSRKKQK
jgi:hypothetical protein